LRFNVNDLLRSTNWYGTTDQPDIRAVRPRIFSIYRARVDAFLEQHIWQPKIKIGAQTADGRDGGNESDIKEGKRLVTRNDFTRVYRWNPHTTGRFNKGVPS